MTSSIKVIIKTWIRHLGYEITIRPVTRIKSKHTCHKPIKVEFLGPSGVGKSTLYREVKKTRRTKDLWVPFSSFPIQTDGLELKSENFPEPHQALLEKKLNAIAQQRDYPIITKLRLVFFFVKNIKKDILLSNVNKENIVLWDDGPIHNFSSQIVGLADENPKHFKDLIKNTAFVFCSCSASGLVQNVYSRENEFGKTRPQHRNKSYDTLLRAAEKNLENKRAFFDLLKKHQASYIEINTEESLQDNAQKVRLFVNGLKGSIDKQ